MKRDLTSPVIYTGGSNLAVKEGVCIALVNPESFPRFQVCYGREGTNDLFIQKEKHENLEKQGKRSSLGRVIHGQESEGIFSPFMTLKIFRLRKFWVSVIKIAPQNYKAPWGQHGLRVKVEVL